MCINYQVLTTSWLLLLTLMIGLSISTFLQCLDHTLPQMGAQTSGELKELVCR